MNINIQPNKHIALLLTPRSGSTVLRAWLASSLNYLNLSELFNVNVVPPKILIEGEDVFVSSTNQTPSTLNEQEHLLLARDNFQTLTKLTDINQFSVFGVYLNSYKHGFSAISDELLSRPDIQIIRVDRADVLYGILSVAAANISGQWHNISGKNETRSIHPIILDISWVEELLRDYIRTNEGIKLLFNPPIIYYEQFQKTPTALINLLNGVPKRIVSASFTKFEGNHKSFIKNLAEVEDFYEQFVNDHKEYFPQYFGKLPHVQIPACQGRQPRDLSRHDRLRAENC